MPPITRGSITALTGPSLHRVLIERGKEYPLEYEGLLNTDGMPWNPITDQQVVGIDAMPAKPEGTAYPLSEHVMGGTVVATAQAFGQALEFTKESWRDELYGALADLVGEMGISARWRKNVHAFSLVNDVFAGTTFKGFDNLSVANTAHVDPGTATTRSNRPSPDIGFGITGIQSGLFNFERQVNPRGRPRILGAREFVLGPQNMFAAREIIGSSSKAFTTNNELNSLVASDLRYRIVHFLITESHWHLHAGPGNHDLWFLLRDDTEFDAFDDPWTGNAVYTVWQRHIPYVGSFRGWFGSTG